MKLNNQEAKRETLMIFLAITAIAFVMRFYNLSTNPPSLYWDEAAFGYNAYSILKTAHDEHGAFMPLFFESFGDWKLPGYFYLLVPSIKLFGLSEFAVRFPSAFLGSLTPPIFFFLTRKITNNTNLSLICMFFLAISPWHIQFSRGGFESTAGLFFTAAATYLFLKALETKNTATFTLSAILFVLSVYTYHAYRIFTPLLVLAITALNFKFFTKNIKTVIIPLILGLVLVAPMVIFTFSQNGRIRATSQSAFKSNELQQDRLAFDQKSKKPLRFLSKYLYSAPAYYSQVALKGYIDHFSPTFLFINGDQIGRHSQVDMGQVYLLDSLLLVLSFAAYKKLKGQGKSIMLFWLLLSPLPAAIVTPTPHAYRTLQMSLPLVFFSALGAYYLFSSKKLLPVKIIFVLVFGFSAVTYAHLLFVHYPKKFAIDWQDGYKQMVKEVEKYQANYTSVYITNIDQVPYIYLLFHQKYDPAQFVKENGTKDAFDKYVFITRDYDLNNKEGKSLYVAPSWQKQEGVWLSAVNDSAGRHIYSLWEIGGQD
ncbi:MAG: phospholipid carrier-dependent glycosyltransferase [Candidatus Curtissbacteria bacterium]